MLGVSGMRGITGRSLTPEVALRYAAAFGTWLRDTDGAPKQIAIGRDGRAGGEAIYQAAIGGLLGAGCAVIELGVATTPTVAVAAREVHGGLIVTASHNPAEWNGLKCLVTDVRYHDDEEDEDPFGDTWLQEARALFPHEAEEVIARFHKGPVYAGTRNWTARCETTKWQQRNDEAGTQHVDRVRVALPAFESKDGLALPIIARVKGWRDKAPSEGSLRTVLDAVNSSGSTVGVPFLSCFGDTVAIHCTGSGLFPHTPEPTRENLSGPGGLCTIVPGADADIGFAQDPDADRLAIVDENGRYIGEEYTLVLSALALLEASSQAGTLGLAAQPVLVTNLSTSRMIDDLAERFGARVERTPVGEAHVARRMIELMADHQGVVLGGEGNGGVIWPEVSFVRDSIVAMGLTLALMARHGKPLSQIVDSLPNYAIVKRKQDIASKDAAKPAIDAVAKAFEGRGRIDLQDGVRVDLDDQKAWLSLRASNTEPIVRLIAEAPDEAAANALLDEVQKLLA